MAGRGHQEQLLLYGRCTACGSALGGATHAAEQALPRMRMPLAERTDDVLAGGDDGVGRGRGHVPGDLNGLGGRDGGIGRHNGWQLAAVGGRRRHNRALGSGRAGDGGGREALDRGRGRHRQAWPGWQLGRGGAGGAQGKALGGRSRGDEGGGEAGGGARHLGPRRQPSRGLGSGCQGWEAGGCRASALGLGGQHHGARQQLGSWSSSSSRQASNRLSSRLLLRRGGSNLTGRSQASTGPGQLRRLYRRYGSSGGAALRQAPTRRCLLLAPCRRKVQLQGQGAPREAGRHRLQPEVAPRRAQPHL